MAQKKKTSFKVVPEKSVEETKQVKRRYWQRKIKERAGIITIVLLVLLGTYLLLSNHAYTTVYRASSYKKTGEENHQYQPFQSGLIRYNKDGVAYVNQKNEEIWIQSAQFNNPIIATSANAFAVGDCGGTDIQVYTEKGLKGEIQTVLPIEKMCISNQGIVSVLLKNESSPQIVTYDATGNILVENQVALGNNGYPTAIQMSPNGEQLAVAYLDVSSGSLKSKVICYDYSESGKEADNHQCFSEEYADTIVPEIFYINDSRFVVVSDHSFTIYAGDNSIEKKQEVTLNQEIKSVFYTKKYIGFILLNEKKSGFEARLYNTSGEQVMSREFVGEYSNVQMIGREIIMYEGAQCCIITNTGLIRFKGSMKEPILAMIPGSGINGYLVMSTNELRKIYLVK